MVTDEEKAQIESAIHFAEENFEGPADLVAYLRHGKKPGPFMLAVLRNDFVKAHLTCLQGDAGFRELALLLVNAVPPRAWGSPQKVNAWMKSFDHVSPAEFPAEPESYEGISF